MCLASNKKRETTHEGRNRTTQIRMFGEKEAYKYSGILESKKWEMKQKKSTRGEQESYSKQNYIAGTL